jgi:hypothetical protein
MTTFGREGAVAAGPHDGREASWASWGRELTTIAGGILATLALAVAVAVVVALVERGRGRRWRWGRYVVADAVVLTLFNFLPVPPLDGGRALVGALGALGGVHLTGDTLFWVHLGGLALAVMPMTVWTRWTRRIDAAAFHWGAPAHVGPHDGRRNEKPRAARAARGFAKAWCSDPDYGRRNVSTGSVFRRRRPRSPASPSRPTQPQSLSLSLLASLGLTVCRVLVSGCCAVARPGIAAPATAIVATRAVR